MSTPTDVPFQDDDRTRREALHGGDRQPSATPAQEPSAQVSPAQEPSGPAIGEVLLPPSETETDLLAARVDGPDDHQGMTDLWRATMALPHWWFIAVGEPGRESPAAATIQDKLMLMTFTNSERARHFAVQNGMISATEDLSAIALAPQEVVESGRTYEDAGIDGLMFDPHVSGYFIPSAQLPIVWEAVHSVASTDPGTELDPQG